MLQKSYLIIHNALIILFIIIGYKNLLNNNNLTGISFSLSFILIFKNIIFNK